MEPKLPDETLGHFERARIVAILEAVHAQDWDRFEELSDEPFSNEESMREQFRTAGENIQAHFDWEAATEIGTHTDKTRVITVTLPNRREGGLATKLILHSYRRNENEIGIWTIHKEFRL